MRTNIYLIALQAGLHRALEFLRGFVTNIEHRRHFIPILRRKSSCREIDRLGHIRVNKTQTLLLSCANKQGTWDFYAIYIDHIFVVIPPTHRVLCTKLVVLRHSGISSNKGLNTRRGAYRYTDVFRSYGRHILLFFGWSSHNYCR